MAPRFSLSQLGRPTSSGSTEDRGPQHQSGINGHTAADAMDEKIDAVRGAAGDKFDELELQVQIFKTVVTDHRRT